MYDQAGEAVFESTQAYLAFDQARRRLTEVLREWASRLDDDAFVTWLREKLDWPRRGPTTPTPYHARTVKLQWYLELALARATQNETAYYDYLPRLRDKLNDPVPFQLVADEDGYAGLSPGE